MRHTLAPALMAALLGAIGAGYAHRPDYLAVQHDGKRTRLWEVVHECRRQIFAGPHHLVRL